ncbi:early nodulin-93 isoform X1 [Vitis vinifera]|nr:early nodulin-93 isoform X1 [Vitis vinifera]
MAKNVAGSPLERNGLASFDQKLAMAKRCSHEGVVAGAKAAVVASIATAIPTMASARWLPWAKANLNHTAQALIISTGWFTFLSFFVCLIVTKQKIKINKNKIRKMKPKNIYDNTCILIVTILLRL